MESFCLMKEQSLMYSLMVRVQFPMRSLDFSVDLILPAALWVLGWTQPLTEMSTRSLPGAKGWSACKADNLITIFEPIV
jgi:hypothetical protein